MVIRHRSRLLAAGLAALAPISIAGCGPKAEPVGKDGLTARERRAADGAVGWERRRVVEFLRSKANRRAQKGDAKGAALLGGVASEIQGQK